MSGIRPAGRRRLPATTALAGAAVVASLGLVAVTRTGTSGAADCGSARGGWRPVGRVAAGIRGARNPDDLRFADMDGDGRADIVTVDEVGGMRVWLNRGGDANGGGGWVYRGRVNWTVDAGPDRIHLADLNNDRKADVLIIRPNGTVDAAINQGGDITLVDGVAPGWWPLGQIARGTGDDYRQTVFFEVTGDGRAEYVVAGAGGALKAWRNDGMDQPGRDGWSEMGPIARGVPAPEGSRVHFVDFNCDRRDDYIVVHPSGPVDVYLNNGGDSPGRDGWIPLGRVAPGAAPADRVIMAELDGDGRADYLVMQGDGSIDGYLNQGGDPA